MRLLDSMNYTMHLGGRIMSLLMNSSDTSLTRIARKVFDKHFELDPMLEIEYDDRRKKLMYNDILYNLGYLDSAIKFDEEKIFSDYAIWVYQLLTYIMKDLDKTRIKEHMIMHYSLLNSVLSEVLSEEEAKKADVFLKKAILITEKEAINFTPLDTFELGKYVDIKQKYLDLLLKNDTRGAYQYIEDLFKKGYDLEVIYIEILQEVMHEIGDLWHKQEISIDKEHYCTATTQMVLSQFYPLIFNSEKNGFKLLTCSVGSELHEMGGRMVSDIFEYYGWDSVYLGASVPNDAVINSIRENKPDLVALSVTMPQHLLLCKNLVQTIKENFPDVRIAVGGRGFISTTALWQQWGVDISTDNASQLVKWAQENIVRKSNIQ